MKKKKIISVLVVAVAVIITVALAYHPLLHYLHIEEDPILWSPTPQETPTPTPRIPTKQFELTVIGQVTDYRRGLDEDKATYQFRIINPYNATLTDCYMTFYFSLNGENNRPKTVALGTIESEVAITRSFSVQGTNPSIWLPDGYGYAPNNTISANPYP